MVLQRGVKAPIWGWTTPGDKVTVTVAGKKASAVADADGKWMAKVGPLKAGGPYTLTISGPKDVTLENVLAGDVWICSGQSNMEMGIGAAANAEQEIAASDYPMIRLYTVTKAIALKPLDTPVGQWLVCGPKTIGKAEWSSFSAVGYYFGRKLYQELKVPIGLIHTSWGGTVAEAWTSAEGLASLKDFDPALEQVRRMEASQEGGVASYQRQVRAWWARNDAGSRAGQRWESPSLDTFDWKSMDVPGAWEKAGLPGFDGVVWFRKEVDLPAGSEAKQFALSLGNIDDIDVTWVNGVKVGETGVYTTPRRYPVPKGLLKAGRNVIAVRVLDTGGDGGLLGEPSAFALTAEGGDSVPLAGPWLYKVSADLSKTTPFPQEVTNNPNVVTVLYNAMVAPLVPFGIKGAIWYQGESNAGRAYQYRRLLPAMIADWRSRFGVGDFPFYIVQLANFTASPTEPIEDAWAELREAQTMTANDVKNAGMAVIIDIGDALDIHPKNKQDVGGRLALAALAKTYGQKVVYSGPMYRSMKREDGKIRLRFDHVEDGLVAKGGKLTGFAVAGADHKFVWADAEIDGNSVVVSSPRVPEPVAVRYAWAANPVCNLFNGAGLPASPFRTDTWPGITASAK
jgi:sialate O-acetylesterase